MLSNKTIALWMLVLLVLLVVPAQAAQFCVGDEAALQSALSTAQGNGENDIIKVVQGTYYGNFTFNGAYNTEAYDIAILGGYAPGCGSRVIDPSNTILDGGEIAKALYVNFNSVCGNVVVDGLTFRRGYALYEAGGLHVSAGSDSGPGGAITVTNCNLTDNVGGYGGGAYLFSVSNSGTGGNIIVTHNTVSGNTAYDGNAGMSITANGYSSASSGNVTVANNTFSSNVAYDYVGAVGIWTSSNAGSAGDINVGDNVVSANESYGAGCGIYTVSQSSSGRAGDIHLYGNSVNGNTNYYNNGGGVFVQTQNSSGTAGGNILLENNTVSGNTSYMDAGGMYISAYTDTGRSGDITLRKNIISGNYAYDGGGGAFVESRCYSTGLIGVITLNSNIIQENTAYEYYGGAYLYSYSSSGTASDINIVNNIIAKNSANGGIGGLYANSSSSSGTVGDITLTNNTITRNTSVYSSGAGASFYLTGNVLNVYNNIIWGNTASSSPDDLYFYNSGPPATTNGYNNLVSVVNGTWTGSGDNIDTDPLFVDPAGGDYHIMKTSPCRNAGLPTAPETPRWDFEGQPRVQVDIGADEYPQANLSGILPLLLD